MRHTHPKPAPAFDAAAIMAAEEALCPALKAIRDDWRKNGYRAHSAAELIALCVQPDAPQFFRDTARAVAGGVA